MLMTKRLQHDIDSVQNWWLDNGMKLNSSKTTIISFTRKTNSIYCKFFKALFKISVHILILELYRVSHKSKSIGELGYLAKYIKM
jgi:hypothetical protein